MLAVVAALAFASSALAAGAPIVSVPSSPVYDSAGKYKLSASVNANGSTTGANIQYGLTTSYGSTFTHETISATETRSFSRITAAMPVGSTVNYRVIAVNASGTTYGPNQTFVVGGPPVVTTAGRPTVWAGTINPMYRYAGNVKANGLPTTTKIQYGHTTSYGSEQSTATVAAGATSKVFASLSHGVHYVLNYRTVATNAAGTTYGPNQTFKVPGKVVRPVYMYPADRSFRQDYNDLIQDAHEQAQEFFADETSDGKTFTLAHRPVVCALPENGAFYGTEVSQYVGSWQKIDAALSACLGSQRGNDLSVYAVYPDIPYATCSAWNRIGGAIGNLTILGHTDLRGLSGETNMSNAPCPGTDFRDGPWGFTGGLAHELGHTFGLPHPPNMEGPTKTCDAPYTPGDCAYTAASLLWQGYTNINTTYLLPANKTALTTSPYFS